MTVSIIAAVAQNRAIGKDNKLLWHLPDDLRFFKETTLGHPVITGRRNYESIPEKYRPLKGRENIVLTSNSDYQAPGARLARSLEEAIEIARELDEEEIFIMGGGKVYYEAIKKDLVDRMYLTLVRAEFDADTFFPIGISKNGRNRLVIITRKMKNTIFRLIFAFLTGLIEIGELPYKTLLFSF